MRQSIVLSTIAVVALSTSAYADALSSWDTSKKWYEQVYSDKAFGESASFGNLTELGWDKGSAAIASAITGDDGTTLPLTLTDDKGILGQLNTAIGNDKKITANYATEMASGKYKASPTLTANVGTKDVTDYTLLNAAKDYLAVAKAKDLATRAKTLMDTLSTNNGANMTASDMSDSTNGVKLGDGADENNKKAVADAILEQFEGIKKSGTPVLSTDDIAKLRKPAGQLDSSEINNILRGLFADSSGILNAYKDLSTSGFSWTTEVSNLNTLEQKIGQTADSLYTDASDKTKANELKADLQRAVTEYQKYATNKLKLDNLAAEATRIEGTVFTINSGKGTKDQFKGDYENIYKANNQATGEIITTQDAIKTAIVNQGKAKLININENVLDTPADQVTSGSQFNSSNQKAKFDQFVAFAKAKYGDNGSDSTHGEDKTTFVGASKEITSKKLTTNKNIIAALELVNTSLSNGGSLIEFTYDNLGLEGSGAITSDDDIRQIAKEIADAVTNPGNDVFKEGGKSIAAFTSEALANYILASVTTKTKLTAEELGKIKTAKQAIEAEKTKLQSELFKLVADNQAQEAKPSEEVQQVIDKIELPATPAAQAAKKELEKAFTITDASGNPTPATKQAIEDKVTALGYAADLSGADAKLYNEYNVDQGASDAQTQLRDKIVQRYGKYGIVADGDNIKLKDNLVILNAKGEQIDTNDFAAVMKRVAVIEQNDKIQAAVDNIASTLAQGKKDSIAVEGLSTLNVQLNNMNKRLGEIRGLDGQIGAWLRAWGGKMSADHDSFKYYSTQLGADQKTALDSGDLYIGMLLGYDRIKSDVKSNAYSVGVYASYIDNGGFFADGVIKFAHTKNKRDNYDLSNQKTFLASFEGGYRFDLGDEIYLEPSLELVTGRVGEYVSYDMGSKTTIRVDGFTPMVFKPQVFVGGAVDDFTYRAGVGGVLNAKSQEASVHMADVVKNLDEKQVSGTSTVKLGKNNHGFVSVGSAYKASDNLRINLGLERSFGGDLTNDYEINMTVRYGF